TRLSRRPAADAFAVLFEFGVAAVRAERAGDLAGGSAVKHQPSSAASFCTVFQLRAVPRVLSLFSISVPVNFERPMPAGYTRYSCLPMARTISGPWIAASSTFTS